MSWAKEYMAKIEEQGFECTVEKFVCHNCVDDYALKLFIEDNAEQCKCDYCGQQSDEEISVHIEKLLHVIMDGIKTEWGDPNNEGVGWDGREGGWQGAKVIDTYDLICDELSDELGIENEDLKRDIYSSISDQQWCQISPYLLREYEENYVTWELFCQQVKHETRYVFFHIEDNPNRYGIIYSQPSQILETIGQSIITLGLINSKAVSYRFYRGRTHNDSTGFSKVEELASPPREFSIYSNRMSPAGIPMFYGATDEATAIEEIRDDKKYVTVGIFENLKNLNLLDLSKHIQFPSLFDEEKRHLRNAVIFIRNLVYDLSMPVTKNNIEHIEYVPTQIVTEFFRRVFTMENGEKIHGILYPSARVSGGVCCVLFIENEDCTQDPNDTDKMLNLSTLNTSQL
ncbi:HEPN-associated N-terminal domain-containing protein [Paenibacillus sp. FSL K6-1096]|uniref:HEPN-associated N-terminal domain-containing protein n=1 Tax=Paenibacillus sp. FSL K6-1096 TaxID=2921460 RepID=UPI0030EB1D3F